ncbi:ABC transporter permease [Nocardioides lianchengensis]|uniref:Putative ABC transport system permease protein n=1 Tax=Nocardioides lianchengensis TaxID=1045774 RepID=A0A1G7C1B9_9ACTN|nr:ABC transporter permease [Nocardioides lianchengensis]NYG09279.1 putative ABC transport system permease protein [Nocardioides lianchengensis]SDE33063.1 putative ABC transport system permease protein [Nocardioides lianchengensis]
MIKLVLSSVRHNLGRYLATLVAIVAGVGFYTAVSVISDGVIDSLEGNIDDQYGNVDVAVVPDEADVVEQTGAQPEPLKVPQAAADQLAALPGVDGSAGILTAPVAFEGSDGKPFATSATGRLWITDADLNPLSVVTGDAPDAAGEVAVDQGLADDEKLKVGAELTLLTLAGPQQVELVGITEFGDSDALDTGGTVSLSEQDAFNWLNSGKQEYESFYLRASGSADDVVAAAGKATPDGFAVESGDEFRDDQREANGSFAQTLKTALQAFAVLALLVGGFVIFNTFSVIVAQRLRELAVLAAIGATPRQLKRSLRLEGLVLGLLGSVLGVVAGYLLTLALQGILALTGNELPGGISFRSANLVSGLFLGTVITVLSVMIPARRAGRTEPIEAMRAAATESADLGRARAVTALVLAALGLLGMLAGSGLATIGAGAVAFVASVFVGAPYLARVGARAARPLLERFGIEGRLAVDNSVRSPKRTATTANALLIGVFLVTLVAVAGASIRDFAIQQVNDVQSADYVVVSQGGTIDPDFVSQLKDVKDVNDVVAFERAPVTIDGAAATVSAGDVAEMAKIANLEVDKGDLADLADGTIAVLDTGDGKAPNVGGTVTVTDSRGKDAELKVVAVLAPTQDTGQTGSILDQASFDSLVGDVAPTIAFVDVASGAQGETKDAIEDLADQRPDITAQEGNALGQLIRTVFDFLIKAVTGLLLMSVLIALIGIVNTMSLSILERRRELGLLRIIGMTDKRVRRMVTLESVLIALLGTLGGMVTGLVVSLLLVLSFNRLSDATITPSIPWVELVAIMVLGVLLGVLAALLPARRSTRMEVLDAISAG